jgi:imidazolonepropionase-like amidohydrolase
VSEPGLPPPGELGGTLLPALCDAHVHSGLVDLRAVRRGGIAIVHDLGGVPGVLTDLIRDAADPASGLPRIEIAGAFLTAPGGYPSDRSWAAPGSWREVRSEADAEQAVAEQVAAGARRIKVALNAVAGPVLDGPALNRLVGAAHAVGVEVVAHVEGTGTTRLALSAGVDVMAHTPWSERLEPGLLRAAAAEQSAWISTLHIHGELSRGRRVAVDNLRGFLEAGGWVMYGTDLGNGPLPLGVNPGEIRALQSAGMSVDDVLAAITDHGPAGEYQTWVPAGLDRDPARFAGSLSTAQVIIAQKGSA